MKYFAGLDVSMKTTFICIVDEEGIVVYKGASITDPVLISEQLFKTNFIIEKAGIESGSISLWLVDELQKLNIPAICVDARKMASFLSVNINKTDENDARGIADAMRCNLYTEVLLKSKQFIELGILLGSRRILVKQRTQIKNAVRGFLKNYGIRLKTTNEVEFSNMVKMKFSEKINFTSQEGIISLLSCFDHLNNEIKNLEKKLIKDAAEDADIRRFMTIPGIGVITAITFKTVIGNPNRFSNSRDVGAYIGMTPRQYSSGEMHRQGRISKCGSKELRFILTEAGIVLLMRTKKWSKLKAWGLKIMRKHGVKKASIAIGRKLAIIMHRMMLDKKDFIYGENNKK